MQHTIILLLSPTLDFACTLREFEFQGRDLFRVYLSEGDTLKFRNCVDAQKGIDYDQVWQGCTAIGQAGDAKLKEGSLKSGKSGERVKSRKQAIAIGLSEARRKGVKVPTK